MEQTYVILIIFLFSLKSTNNIFDILIGIIRNRKTVIKLVLKINAKSVNPVPLERHSQKLKKTYFPMEFYKTKSVFQLT